MNPKLMLLNPKLTLLLGAVLLPGALAAGPAAAPAPAPASAPAPAAVTSPAPETAAAPEPSATDPAPTPPTLVVATAAASDLDALLDRLATARLVFVGETHDRYEDHLTQLAVIRGLVERGRPVVIGAEFFQQPFQPVLDAWVAGTIDEATLLRETGYFERWRFDYRLYRPILQYARAQRIPVIALNVPAELVERVSAEGLAAVRGDGPTPPPHLPAEVDRDDAAYRERLRAFFEQHPTREGADFERFLDVQLLWDEGMAERAAAALAAWPDHTLVVLAGVGHVEYRHGIPRRVERRAGLPGVVLVNGQGRAPAPERADYLVYPATVPLPQGGLLGVILDDERSAATGADAGVPAGVPAGAQAGAPAGAQAGSEAGARAAPAAEAGRAGATGIGIKDFAEVSGARDAGAKAGDRIVGVGGRPIADYADIRIALLDARPGDRLPVEVERRGLLGGRERLTLDVQLH